MTGARQVPLVVLVAGPVASVPGVEITTGLGWGGTVAWVSAVVAVVVLGLVARWAARPARRPGRRAYRVPRQPDDRRDNPGR